jgi:hypothetical protein
VVGKSDRSPRRANVLNRTSGGVRLAVQQDIPAGSILRMLAGNAPANTPWAEVSVRWCEEANGYFEVGCQFQGKLPWSVLLMFG